MVRRKTLFSCTECGTTAPKWQGQCPGCGLWNTLVETVADRPSSSRYQPLASLSEVTPLSEVEAAEDERIATGISELDRVLGGGIVMGGVVLIGGDPGIGKSTLLLQAMAHLTRSLPSLYISGEESARQVALRAKRLNLDALDLPLLAEIQLEKILSILEERRPRVVVVDSVQTVFSEALQSAPGSVAQVRECAAQLTRFAKRTGTSLFLVGHVTKEGALAGPRVLEHMVDTVLYFEGDTGSSFRLVRAFKNRFGAVNELGVFAMSETGLKNVTNPSALFLSRHGQPVPGTCVVVTQEGSRPLLVEIQALVDSANTSNPKRLSVGLESNRLAMLLAVLHRHVGIACSDQDVFINAVGGVKITEPAADLAVLAAIVSSIKSKPVKDKLIIFGEVGLAGEIRPVQRGQERLKEAAKLGFTKAIIPVSNQPKQKIPGMDIKPVNRLEDLLDHLF